MTPSKFINLGGEEFVTYLVRHKNGWLAIPRTELIQSVMEGDKTKEEVAKEEIRRLLSPFWNDLANISLENVVPLENFVKIRHIESGAAA